MLESEKLEILLQREREKKANGGKTLEEIEKEVPFLNRIFNNFKNVQGLSEVNNNKISAIAKETKYVDTYKEQQIKELKNNTLTYYKAVIEKSRSQVKEEREKRIAARTPGELNANDKILQQLELNNKLQLLNHLKTNDSIVSFAKENINDGTIRNILKEKFNENLDVVKIVSNKEEEIKNIDADLDAIDYKLKVLEANQESLCIGLTEKNEMNFINI